MNCLYEIRNAGVRYGSAEVLRSAHLRFNTEEFVSIAGPNGAGKSTLLLLMAGLAAPSYGECLFLGRNAHQWNRRDFARRVAVVLQTEPTAFPFTVEEIVAMGRMPHSSGFYESPDDRVAVGRALAATETESLRTRDYRTLSGGEKQRVVLASALAQQPDVLLLDEPANHLDVRHQLSLHRLLRDLSRQGLLVVSVTHDLNLAAAYTDRILLLDEGRIRADGTPAEVLAPGLINDIFRVGVEVHYRPSGQPWLIYGE